jgi:hypothetical protein
VQWTEFDCCHQLLSRPNLVCQIIGFVLQIWFFRGVEIYFFVTWYDSSLVALWIFFLFWTWNHLNFQQKKVIFMGFDFRFSQIKFKSDSFPVLISLRFRWSRLVSQGKTYRRDSIYKENIGVWSNIRGTKDMRLRWILQYVFFEIILTIYLEQNLNLSVVYFEDCRCGSNCWFFCLSVCLRGS